jgi:hypothetical protein
LLLSIINGIIAKSVQKLLTFHCKHEEAQGSEMFVLKLYVFRSLELKMNTSGNVHLLKLLFYASDSRVERLNIFYIHFHQPALLLEVVRLIYDRYLVDTCITFTFFLSIPKDMQLYNCLVLLFIWG